MASVLRRVLRPNKDVEAEPTRQTPTQSDVRSGAADSKTIVRRVSDESPESVIRHGRAMQLLRQVHLVDPIQSPSWSGTPRSTRRNSPSVLDLLVEDASDSTDLYEKLQPGIVDLTDNPSLLSVRGILLDTIRAVGPVIEQSITKSDAHSPPKWLKKFSISTNSSALRDVSPNSIMDTSQTASKGKPTSQSTLQDKYNDFISPLISAVRHHPTHPAKSSKPFDNVRMCVSETGYFGIVPPSAKVGDILFMVERDPLKSVFVVRKHPVRGFYLWNGLVYMHDLAPVVDNTYATDRILVW